MSTSSSAATFIVGNDTGVGLWKKALDLLDNDLRTTLTSTSTHKRDTINQVLKEAEARRQECIRKQWRVKIPGGKTIILRDVMEKIAGFVNRYKDVVTIAVQYDPVNASLPWAAIRFLLSFAIGDVQVWGALFADLESISRLMFRCKVYEDLYVLRQSEISIPLEDTMVRLYAEMLVVLANAIKYIRRCTGVRAFASAVLPNEAPQRMKAIEIHEKEIEKLAALANAKIIQQDSDKALQALLRLDVHLTRLVDVATRKQQLLDEEKLSAILMWLSSVPVTLHHNTIADQRMSLSGDWLLHHFDFQDWLASSSSSFLLLQGIPGSGKSSIFSAIVDNLLPKTQSNPPLAPCAYFYCSSASFELDRANANSILRSIVRQLSVNSDTGHVSQVVLPVYDKAIEEAKKRRTDPAKLTIDACVNLLLDLTATNPAYIAIDAVDELSSEDRATLLEALRAITDRATSIVKIFVTSRDNSHLQALLQSATKIRIDSTSNRNDVHRFIDREMQRVVTQKRILNGNASAVLQKKITAALKHGAGEMFLWPKLQLDILCRKKTEHDILTTLGEGLTEGLDQVYGLIFDQILALDPTAKRIAQCIITWLLFAKHPLHSKMWHSVLSLALHSDIAEATDILDVCHHLVILDSQAGILRFCHASVQDFMRRKHLFAESSGHQLLAEVCLHQCTAGPNDFDPVWDDSPVRDLYQYAAVYWPDHVQQASRHPNANQIIQDMIRFVFAEDGETVSFSFDMWIRWLQEGIINLPIYHHLTARFEPIQSSDVSPLLVACVFGLSALLDHILNKLPTINLEQKSGSGYTSLYLACSYGHQTLVSRLLEHNARADVACGDFGSPMHVACFKGHIEVVKILLSYGVSTGPSTAFTSAFDAACSGGHEDVAMLLVKESHCTYSQDEYDTIVSKSLKAGFVELISWLLQPSTRKKLLNSNEIVGNRDAELISNAIKHGNVSVLQVLLRNRPQPSVALPRDAMAIASLSGHARMVTFLHETYSMNPEEEGRFGTALRSASLMGHESIVRLLVGLGADPKAIGSKGDALQAAAQKGQVQVMRLLIDEGIDINQMGEPYGTSLQAASYHGHMEAVKLLLEHGANINQSGKFKDALHAATRGGHDQIASLLLEKGYKTLDNTSLPHVSRGDDHRKNTTKGQSLEQNADDTDSKTDVTSDDERDDQSESSQMSSDLQDSEAIGINTSANSTEIVIAARVGNIPTLHQHLLRVDLPPEDVEEALNVAASCGQLDSLKLLLRDGAKHIPIEEYLQRSFVTALYSDQIKAAQLLIEYSKEWFNEIDYDWCKLLEAGALQKDPASFAFILNHMSELTLSVMVAIATALREAADHKCMQRATILWDHLMAYTHSNSSVPVFLPNATRKAGMLRAFLEKESPSTLGQAEQCLKDLLMASIQTDNAKALDFMLTELEVAEYDAQFVLPVAVSACKFGLMGIRGLLKYKSGRLALTPEQISVCLYTAMVLGYTALFRCILEEAFDRIVLASNKGILVEAFILAAQYGRTATFKFGLESSDFHKCVDDFEDAIYRALIAAAKARHKRIARLCLREGLDVDRTAQEAPPVRDFNKYGLRLDLTDIEHLGPMAYPPHYLDSYDFGNSRQSLKPRYFQSTFDSEQEYTALQAALKGFESCNGFPYFCRPDMTWDEKAAEPQESLVLLMLKHGADPNDAGPRGEYPLQLAIRYASDGVVQALLEAGADVEACRDIKHNSAITLAMKRDDPMAFRIILRLIGANESIPTTKDGALISSFMLVLEQFVELWKQRTNDYERELNRVLYPMSLRRSETDEASWNDHLASWSDYVDQHVPDTTRLVSLEEARKFMSSGIKVMLTKALGRLPGLQTSHKVFSHILMLAAAAGDHPIVKLMIKHGVSTDYTFDNDSALDSAARLGHWQILKTLLDAGAPPRLHGAIIGGNVKAVKLVIERGANPRSSEYLYLAVQTGKAEIVQTLLDSTEDPLTLILDTYEYRPLRVHHPRIGSVYKSASNILCFAVESDNLPMARCLLKAGLSAQHDPEALIVACEKGNMDLVECLLTAGAETNVLRRRTETCRIRKISSPLYTSCEKGYVEVVRQLVRYSANMDFDIGDQLGLPLIVAASNGHLEIVQLLLEHDADPNRQTQGLGVLSKDDQVWLQAGKEDAGTAVSRGFYNLPKSGSASNSKAAETCRVLSGAFTALSEACKAGRYEVVKQLVSRGATIAGPPNAIVATFDGDWSAKKIDILEFLIENAFTHENWEAIRDEALYKAAEKENCEAFELLVQYTCPSPKILELACVCGSISTACLCWEHFQGSSASATGLGALHQAAYNSHEDLVVYLLTNGANPNALNASGESPLVAALRGFRDFLDPDCSLELFGPPIRITNFENIIRSLINHGATVSGRNAVKALHIACRIGHVEIVRLLLDQEGEMDDDKRRLSSPLFTALDYNNPSVVALLLERGANPNLRRAVVPGSQHAKKTAGHQAQEKVNKQYPLEAALGRCSTAYRRTLRRPTDRFRSRPSLVRTFLHSATDVQITGKILMSFLWSSTRELDYLLESKADVVVPEEVILALMDARFHAPDGLLEKALDRSKFGVTEAMYAKAEESDTWYWRSNTLVSRLQNYEKRGRVGESTMETAESLELPSRPKGCSLASVEESGVAQPWGTAEREEDEWETTEDEGDEEEESTEGSAVASR